MRAVATPFWACNRRCVSWGWWSSLKSAGSADGTLVVAGLVPQRADIGAKALVWCLRTWALCAA